MSSSDLMVVVMTHDRVVSWRTAPCQIFLKQESLESGGFQDSAGYPSDVAFACKLAHDYGVRFYPEVIGVSLAWEHIRRRM